MCLELTPKSRSYGSITLWLYEVFSHNLKAGCMKTMWLNYKGRHSVDSG